MTCPRWGGEAAPRGKQSGGGLKSRPRFYSNRINRSVGVAVAQQFARRRPGAIAFAEGLDTVHDNRAIALRTLHATPFAARQIVHDLADPVRLDAKTVEVVDHD